MRMTMICFLLFPICHLMIRWKMYANGHITLVWSKILFLNSSICICSSNFDDQVSFSFFFFPLVLKPYSVYVNCVMFEGNSKYQIRGCSGLGGFAQVYKAYIDSNPDDVVALKVIPTLICIFCWSCRYFFGIIFCPIILLCRFKSLRFLGNSTCIANLISASLMLRFEIVF